MLFTVNSNALHYRKQASILWLFLEIEQKRSNASAFVLSKRFCTKCFTKIITESISLYQTMKLFFNNPQNVRLLAPITSSCKLIYSAFSTDFLKYLTVLPLTRRKCFHTCLFVCLSVCLSVCKENKITQKVVDELTKLLGVALGQRTID